MKKNSFILNAALISERRRLLGLTMQELGDKIGVSKSTVKKWECGTIHSMRSDKLLPLSQALGIPASQLIGNIPENCFEFERSETVRVPIIGRVAAGLSCHAEGSTEGYECASRELIRGENDYVYLRVQGDSMAPLILDGDLVLIRCQDYVDSGSYAVVIIDNEDGVVKKLRYGSKWLELVSENPYYPVRRFEGNEVDRVRIFGQVIESKHIF